MVMGIAYTLKKEIMEEVNKTEGPAEYIFQDFEMVLPPEIQVWKRFNEPKTTELVSDVRCRLYKRDWYVGARAGEDNLFYPVVGRQTYRESGVIPVEIINVAPSPNKMALINELQKGIDKTQKYWALSKSNI